MKMFTKLWRVLMILLISSSVLMVQAQKNVSTEKAPVKSNELKQDFPVKYSESEMKILSTTGFTKDDFVVLEKQGISIESLSDAEVQKKAEEILMLSGMLNPFGIDKGQDASDAASSYTFSQSAGTYTPITGGTLVAASAPGTGLFLDDNNYSAQPIPFTFVYNGVPYTDFNINTNGHITFGTTLPPTSNYSPISSTTAYAGAVVAFARDNDGRFALQATTTSGSNVLTAVPSGQFGGVVVGEEITATNIPAGATITAFDAGAGTITLSANATATGTLQTCLVYSATIRTQTLGTTPNRVHVIQFTNFKRYGTTYYGELYNFQIRLYETTNVAEVVYGTVVGNTTSTTGQVGLRGATNADYNNRTTTTDWTATTAGTLNSSTCTMSATVYPPSGRTFTWTPPATPGDPYGPTPANLATAVLITTNLGWSFGANTNNYDLLFGTVNPPVTTVVTNGVATNPGSYDPPGNLAYNTTYYWQVISKNGAGNTNGPVWSFTTSTNLPYAPTTPSPATASSGVSINADLGWTFGINTETYDLFFGTVTPPVTKVVDNAAAGTTGTYDPGTMNYSTTYYWQVVARNSAKAETPGPIWSFTTECGAITTLPWTENFDAVVIPALPSCWLKENGDWVTTNNANSTYDADAHSGTQFLRESWLATNEYVWTPGFALTSGTSYDFSFWWAGDTYAGWTGDIFYNTTQISTGATQLGTSFVVDATVTTKTYAQVINTFVAPSTATYYFAIRVNCPTSTPWYLSFDDFKLDLTPAGPFFTFVPETVACGYGPNGGYSVEHTYTVAGNNLTAGPVVVTAPANFQVSTTGGGVGFGSSVSLSYTPPTLTATTIYVRCAPTAPNTYYTGNIGHAGGGATGNVAVTGNSDLFATYCGSMASSTIDEEIFSVTVNSITNAYDCFTVAPGAGSILNRYSNFYPLGSLTNLQQGIPSSFTILEDECDGATYYSNGCAIWIDYNQDGDFLDADEQVYSEAGTTISPRTITGNFTVPVTATLGVTAMRITVAEGYYGATLTPCLAYSYGETEDYKVTITLATSPYMTATPTSLDFGSVVNGGTSAEFSYLLTGGNLTPAGGNITITPPANFEVSATAGGPYSATPIITAYSGGAISKTIYAVFKPTASSTIYNGIITNVGGGASANVTVTGSSPCDAFLAPYTQDFTTWPPVCWDVTLGTYDWIQYTTTGASAEANFWSQTSGNTDIMTTPVIDVTGMANPALSFDWSHLYNATYPNDTLKVFVSDNNGTTWTQIWMLGNINFNSNDGATNTTPGTFVTSGTIDLAPFGNSLVIKFFGKSGYGPNLFVDNVSVFNAAYGTLTGHVYKYGTTTPIAGAAISFGTYNTTTGLDGLYSVPSVLVGTYTVSCSASGYVGESAPGIIITDGGTTTQNFYLKWAEIVANPTLFNENIAPDAQLDKTLTLTNNAPAALNYTTSLQFLTDGVEKSKAAGDILLDLNIEAATADVGNLGAEFDGTYYYVTGSNGGVAPFKLYKLNQAGTLVATYDQPTQATTVWGMRDLAYNAGKIYGGSEDGFYQFDIATGTFTTLFTGNLGLGVIRGLAYYPATGNFLSCNYTTAITEFTSAGVVVGTYTAPAGLSAMYGLAWDSWNNKLWVFDQSGTPASTFYEYDITTQALTGVSYLVPLQTGLTDQIAGGTFFSTSAITGKAVLGGLLQGTDAAAASQDHLILMELNVTETWLSITANGSGTVPGTSDGSIGVTVHFDATGYTNGTVKTANIVISSNALNLPVVTIPVTMNVVSGYTVSGNVYYGTTGTTKPLATNTTVTLNPHGSTATGTGGYYELNFVVDGNYKLSGSTTKAWGGLQAFDATLIARYLGSIVTFTNLQKRAADLNLSSTITAFDGTLIKRRLGSIATPQWTAPTYVFDGPFPTTPALDGLPVTVSGGNVSQELRTLCSGDLNASYTPPAE
jgi:hypothetical protein